jgi:hypothetical protein
VLVCAPMFPFTRNRKGWYVPVWARWVLILIALGELAYHLLLK